ncbi:MAG TPA: molybdate ABC transporter permease subunit [Dehalococcoidia bacterium]|jgi:molybdate transport system permease protein|nr:molybdate ABC transporter permease subunit [Chloroflexota bacterium]MDP5877067.1 molybdate ABC transporter permease subunit [Dehalococcoidia bacterium]MDP6274385.1 molybdate ABC transporter permease subunit [Dehalococcoidia bacterium]MDP7161578.1 molybdate ABC transporter permease subunit [Dehalococcoidia bacterium]MDP7214026.1 molybdate ABC transporter permease subunit [Dehalococcoidia bacterium]
MSSDLTIVLLSLRVAVAAMLMALPIAFGLAWILVRKQLRGRFLIEAIVSLPLALPPVVIGYGLLILLGNRGPFDGLAFTAFAASLASAIVALPLIVRTFVVALEAVDPRFELAARSLGANPWRVLVTVTIPLAYRGLLAGTLIGFVRALSEFGATIVVAGNIPGRTQTLPLGIFTRIQAGDDAAAYRLVAVSIALAIATLIVHDLLLRRGGLSGRRHRAGFGA